MLMHVGAGRAASLACIAVCLAACSCNSVERTNREKAGKSMSNAITIWRNACTFTDVDPELVHQICRGSSDTPVSWRFTVTGAIANQIDAPPKVFDESWDSPQNSYYRNHKLYRDTFA